MKELNLQPEQLLVPGEYELGDENILNIYFRIFNQGGEDFLPPVVIAKNRISNNVIDPIREYEKNVKLIEEEKSEIKKLTDLLQEATIIYFSDTYAKTKTKPLFYEIHPDSEAHKLALEMHLSGWTRGGDDSMFYIKKEFLDNKIASFDGQIQRSFDIASKNLSKYNPILDKAIELRRNSAKYILIDGNHRSVAATLTHKPIKGLLLRGDGDLKTARKMIKKGSLFEFHRPEESLDELVAGFWDHCKDKVDEFGTVRQRVDKLTSNGDLPDYMKERYLRN